MYLSGMGGMGKSQVIKALLHCFKKRRESYCFIVLAPARTAAALIGDSTYHSALGVGDGKRVIGRLIPKVKEHLQFVNFIFIDEISMISLADFYKIHSRLIEIVQEAHNKHVFFGAINMIFAGDFGQLPPVMGGENSALHQDFFIIM